MLVAGVTEQNGANIEHDGGGLRSFAATERSRAGATFLAGKSKNKRGWRSGAKHTRTAAPMALAAGLESSMLEQLSVDALTVVPLAR